MVWTSGIPLIIPCTSNVRQSYRLTHERRGRGLGRAVRRLSHSLFTVLISRVQMRTM